MLKKDDVRVLRIHLWVEGKKFLSETSIQVEMTVPASVDPDFVRSEIQESSGKFKKEEMDTPSYVCSVMSDASKRNGWTWRTNAPDLFVII